MLRRLSRTVLRVFPALLLVVVGLLAALFRRRRGTRAGVPVRVSAPPTRGRSTVRRRGAAIVVLSLLLGIGLLLAVIDSDGTLVRFLSPRSASNGDGPPPVTALSQTEVGDLQGKRPGAVVTEDRAVATEDRAVVTKDQAVVTPPAPSDVPVPTFDTVRVEPAGDLVVAGRAAPNGTVELLVDGRPAAKAVADANGQFVIVSPALPAGTSDIGLRVTDRAGATRQSRDTLAVVVSPSRDTRPLIALTSPDKPTVVLSQPGATPPGSRARPEELSRLQATPEAARPPAPGSGAVAPRDDLKAGAEGDEAGAGAEGDEAKSGAKSGAKPGVKSGRTGRGDRPGAERSMPTPQDAVAVPPGSGPMNPADGSPSQGAVAEGSAGTPPQIVSVDAQGGGKLFVTGRAAADASVRFYLNDTLIAPARVGRDGVVTFAIGGGVKPGSYTVRLDQVDEASGKVRSRVEVPFSVPDVARIDRADRPATASPETATAREDRATPALRATPPIAAPPATAPRQAQAAGPSDGPRDATAGSAASAFSEPLPNPPEPKPEPKPDPAIVFVPEIKTARIERGDSLWAISRRTYGDGDRYTAIYDANQDQIRDPDLIYPGQVFVLPRGDAVEAGRNDTRD